MTNYHTFNNCKFLLWINYFADKTLRYKNTLRLDPLICINFQLIYKKTFQLWKFVFNMECVYTWPNAGWHFLKPCNCYIPGVFNTRIKDEILDNIKTKIMFYLLMPQIACVKSTQLQVELRFPSSTLFPWLKLTSWNFIVIQVAIIYRIL